MPGIEGVSRIGFPSWIAMQSCYSQCMRIILVAAVLGVLTAGEARAEEGLIRIDSAWVQGSDRLKSPSITTKPGVPLKVEVTQPVASPGGLQLATGVSLEGTTAWKDGRIAYDLLLRVRKADGKGGEEVQTFATREVLLHGLAEPGKETEVKCGDGIVATLRFSPAKA